MVCVAAYVSLAAYAYYGIQKEQLVAKNMRLSAMTQRQQELLRKRDVLDKARLFTNTVSELRLERQEWLFYDVNVQGDFAYEAAQVLVQQCSDSELAYFWPISLSIKSIDKSAKSSKATTTGEDIDVQVSVKGRFVAHK